MVESVVMQPFGLVLIVAAHMVLNDAGHADITGIVGHNITLQFTFNTNITITKDFGVYKSGVNKIAQKSSPTNKSCFEVYPENSTLLYHISNLTLNHTDVYWATLYNKLRVIESNKVQLIIRAENRSTTVPPMSTSLTTTQRSDGSSSFLSSRVVTMLLVSPVMLLVVLLPFFICCSVKPRDQQQEPQRNSNPTLQETIDVPGASLVYSVLDFPKRSPAPVELSPSGTEYATVSYLTEKRYGLNTSKCKADDCSQL